ncbi:hypothetical protein SEPCBS57363_002713 [Sporothrix epigloea]|uniref:GPI anchored serine-threonineeeee rich protein n=1 Tax=Sporothrix epigloea TaxID=1892477 RepID=A0ABP0DHF6_9PEZI
MFASFYLTVLAFVVTLVAAGSDISTAISGTTTSTISMTQTITITRCNPSVTNCPANRHNTTTTAHWPVSNSSTVAWPTSYFNKSSSTVIPTGSGAGTVVSSTVVVVLPPPTAAAPTAPAAVSTSAGQSLFIQSGLLMGGLAAAIAILA